VSSAHAPAPHQVCTCFHGIGLHAIRANGARGACSVIYGPHGHPCGCNSFTIATDEVADGNQR